MNNEEYFEKISNLFKHAQEPLHAIAELNLKTLQSYAYLKPEDLSKITKPNELLEKQLELVIANSHKALDYMQQSFHIVEKALLSFTQEKKTKADGKK
jgi:hypothetical protein